MKLAPLFAAALLTLVSCAPKAIVLSEGFDLNLQNQTEQPSAVAETPPAPLPEPPPTLKPNDGLLDPSGLTTMPADRDMKATVEQPKTSAVIATPPKEEEPTSE